MLYDDVSGLSWLVETVWVSRPPDVRNIMRIELRLFAVAKVHANAPSVALDLPEDSTVSDLKQALALAVPSLAPLIPKIRFAIDSEYATDDTTIPAGAQLAAIPPVSGG